MKQQILPKHAILGNAVRPWYRLIRGCDGRVRIFSPFVTRPTVDTVLLGAYEKRIEVYTVFSVQNFITGASSLSCVKYLLDHDVPVYHLPKLHANLVLCGQDVATVGSQNLTGQGTRSKEATVVITEARQLRRVNRLVSRWLQERYQITKAAVEYVEQHVLELSHGFRKLKADAARIERAAHAIAWEPHRKRRQSLIRRVRSRMARIVPKGEAPLGVARDYVWESAYWFDHPAGYPVWAPRHANRIYGTNGDWKIDFGANTFLVGRALRRCYRAVRTFLTDAMSKQKAPPFRNLRSKLKKALQQSVGNVNGDEYYRYPMTGAYLKLGSQAINGEEFVDRFIADCDVKCIYERQAH